MTNDIVSEIDLRFVSGNGIPVERASIRAEEWHQLKSEIDGLKHDLSRYMDVANAEVNESERLRSIAYLHQPGDNAKFPDGWTWQQAYEHLMRSDEPTPRPVTVDQALGMLPNAEQLKAALREAGLL